MAFFSFESLTTTALFISIAFLAIRMIPSVGAWLQHCTETNVLVECYEWYTQSLSLPWQLILGIMAFNLVVGLTGLDGNDTTVSKPMGWMVQNEQDKQAFIKQHMDPFGYKKDAAAAATEKKEKAS